MKIKDYLLDIESERVKRRRYLTGHSLDILKEWHMLVDNISNEQVKTRLKKVMAFAQVIDYSHVGLSSNIYFMHPVRVSLMAILVSHNDKDKLNSGIIGLLHNVFELSDHSFEDIAALIGEDNTNQILDLTVNRKHQWDLQYKYEYYLALNRNPQNCRIVKILDKLDNMYLLDLNDNELIKRKYLEEIEKYILPMTQADIPELYSYFETLFNFQNSKLKNENV